MLDVFKKQSVSKRTEITLSRAVEDDNDENKGGNAHCKNFDVVSEKNDCETL